MKVNHKTVELPAGCLVALMGDFAYARSRDVLLSTPSVRLLFGSTGWIIFCEQKLGILLDVCPGVGEYAFSVCKILVDDQIVWSNVAYVTIIP